MSQGHEAQNGRQAAPVVPDAFFATEHEEALIAMAIIDLSSVDSVADMVSKNDFAEQVLGITWMLLLDMRDLGEVGVDVMQVRRMLINAKVWEQFGGYARLGALASTVANASAIKYHAKQVVTASHRRRLSNFAKQLYKRVTDPGYETQDIATWAAAAMDAYAANPTEKLETIAEAAAVAVGRIAEARRTNKSMGTKTRLNALDLATGGMYGGELTTLAARPSIGKSALATQIGYQMAIDNEPVMLVSLEMEQWEVAIRVLASETGVDVRKLRSAIVTDEDLSKVKSSTELLAKVPMFIWRPRRTSVRQIRAKAKLMQATRGLSMLILDYLSLIRPEDTRAPRHEQISGIMKDLKSLAGELNVPVMVLAQINRTGEGKEPTLADLKDSGSIEEDSNNVWLLHRASRDAHEAKLNIAKARNGPTGHIEMTYEGSLTMFHDKLPNE